MKAEKKKRFFIFALKAILSEESGVWVWVMKHFCDAV